MRADSSTAIGVAAPRLMATNGAKVVINGRDETMIDAVAGEIRGAGGVPTGTAGEARFLSCRM